MDDTMIAQLREEMEAGAGADRIKHLARVYDDWADQIFAFVEGWHAPSVSNGMRATTQQEK